MRNEYFRKVPFAWRNVCLEERTSLRVLPKGFPLPGGTYELASTSERFLCLEERTSLRVPGGTYEENEYFRKFPFSFSEQKPSPCSSSDHFVPSDHCLFGLHNRCCFKILTVILTV
jgi:hypothetical protein